MSWQDVLKEDSKYNNKLKAYSDKLSKIKFEGIEDAEKQGYKVMATNFTDSIRYIIYGDEGHTGTFSVNFAYEPVPEEEAKKAIELLEGGGGDDYSFSVIKTGLDFGNYSGGTSIKINHDDFKVNLNVSYTQSGNYTMQDEEKNKVKWF